jgi:hypothetical protein
MIGEYKNIIKDETHILVRHGRYSKSDIDDMTVWERRKFINSVRIEFEEIKKEQQKQKSTTISRQPRR